MRFWRVEVPFAMPQLIWNMMMSMSGGWFFVVASEAISVGDTTVTLPGIGSYIALAIEQRDLGGGRLGDRHHARGHPASTTSCCSGRWSPGPTASASSRKPASCRRESWVLDVLRRSRLVDRADARRSRGCGAVDAIALVRPRRRVTRRPRATTARLGATRVWNGVGHRARRALALWQVARFVTHAAYRSPRSARRFLLGLATMARVVVLIAIASADLGADRRLGRHCGRDVARIVQPIAQFLAAFPANLLFPIVVSAIVALRLDPDIWLSPLMILGTQWYILFNVIAGAAAIPAELRDVGANLRVRRLAVVAEDRAAGGLSVLRHRRDHRFGRLVERQHRRRGRELGRQQAARRTGSAPTSRRRPRPATSIASCSGSR